MIRYLNATLLLAGVLLALATAAADDEVKAGVQISVDKDREFWAGQQITLNLDLKTTGFSFSDTHFNLPEVDGAFLMQTDTTTIKSTEKIDNRDWQILRYPLALYPQRAGLLEVPPINVRFVTSAGFGTPSKAFEFETQATPLTVTLPPGVKPGDLVVITDSLTLDYDWQPATGAANTGDAVTLSVIRKASDISAMLLPPLPVFRVEGLAAYPQTPGVRDRTDRGELTGERSDAITWVVEKPGVYKIPGIRFQWWDPTSRELKQQVVPGLSLDIQSSIPEGLAPAATEESGTYLRQFSKPWILGVAGLLVVVSLLLFWRRRRSNDLNNEKSAFATLERACKDNHAGEAYSALHAWIEYFPGQVKHHTRPVTLAEFARICEDRQLNHDLRELQEVLVSSTGGWQGHELLQSLQRVRRSISRQKTLRSKARLAPLNP